MKILVRVTSNYGQRAVYPVCETARLLADLTGKKTFPDYVLQQIKALGYEIQVEQVSV